LSHASALKSITAYELPSKPAKFTVKLVNRDPQLSFMASTDNVGVVGYISSAAWTYTSAKKGVKYTYSARARDAADYLSGTTALTTITAQ